jgi:hypothetical protein
MKLQTKKPAAPQGVQNQEIKKLIQKHLILRLMQKKQMMAKKRQMIKNKF